MKPRATLSVCGFTPRDGMMSTKGLRATDDAIRLPVTSRHGFAYGNGIPVRTGIGAFACDCVSRFFIVVSPNKVKKKGRYA